MIAKNPAQLKAWIRNLSKDTNVNANIILQNYMLERLLERISISKYKNNFILKGRNANKCNGRNRSTKHIRYGCNNKRF